MYNLNKGVSDKKTQDKFIIKFSWSMLEFKLQSYVFHFLFLKEDVWSGKFRIAVLVFLNGIIRCKILARRAENCCC